MNLIQRFMKKAGESVVITTTSNAKIIEQIHSEFNNAGEELLKEANEILSNSMFNCDKAEKLEKAGFTSVPEVKEVNQKKAKKKLAESTIRTVQEYRLKYPNHKFITEDMVKEICEKYNLVCGDISLYKGFVPLHNLNQIEQFTNQYPFSIWKESSRWNDNPKTIDMSSYEIRPSSYGRYFHFHPKSGPDKQVFQSDNGKEFYASGVINGVYYSVSQLTKATMQICAPIKDMNTKGMGLNGYKLQVHIPDPVVLQPVPDGYLIVTAWGEESSDPLVINNNIMN